jgi:hypothetical protein
MSAFINEDKIFADDNNSIMRSDDCDNEIEE